METASESTSLRLGLFGGSFDPVHLGHLEIARSAKELFDLNEVHFILANVSPFKFQDKPKDHENAEAGVRQECKRAEILKLALEDYAGTARKRTSSRLRRTNDRSVPSVHEDHEDDENAEIEDCEQSWDRVSEIIQDYLERHLSVSAVYYESARAFPEFIKGDFFQDKYDPPNFLYELALVEWTEIELRNSSEKQSQQLKLNYPITKIRLLMKECPEEIDELKMADVDKEPEILEIRQKNVLT
jgi:cytidyltransferase-like protein